MNDPITLHLSKYTAKDAKKGDKFLGPWCDPLKFFKDDDCFLCDTYLDFKELKKRKEYCNNLYVNILQNLTESLNKHHKVNFSQKFWEILLSNWLTFVIDNLHFYYLCLKNTHPQKYVVPINDHFPYNKLSDVFVSVYKDEYIFSLLSFLVKTGQFNNLSYYEIPHSLEQMPEVEVEVRKPNMIRSLAFKLFNKKSSKNLSYGIAGMNKWDYIKIFLLHPDYAQSFKNYNTNYKVNADKKRKFTCRSLSESSEFSILLTKFIEKNIPTTLVDNFDILVKNACDYKNKLKIIASTGMYYDEQLIEIALAKQHNNAKIFSVQEAGNGLSEFESSEKYLYLPIDHYITWGWSTHLGIQDMFTPAPSRLSTIKNTHKESNESILYYTKFPIMYAWAYNSINPRNWKRYLENRIDFMRYIGEHSLNKNLVLKLHHSRTKGYDEHELMNMYNCSYNEYKSESGINMFNCAILYVDYLSGAVLEAMVSNTPIFMCFDESVQSPSDEFRVAINKFKNVGIAFDSPSEAALQISNIYPNREEFWNSNEIQLVRKWFLGNFVNTSKDWLKDTLKVIRNL